MTLNLSIKNVPEEIVAHLRERAKRHHRSLQGELLTILEEAAASKKLTIREDRDARYGHRAADFQFIGSGRSASSDLTPISERHDEALAEDLSP